MSSDVPTLLRQGMLIPHMGENKQDLDKFKPINYILDFLEKLRLKTGSITNSDKFVILLAKTGAGKSTILPTEIYKKFKSKTIITQPRVLTAVNIPKDIAKRGELKLYVDIGYQTQNNVKKSENRKSITFMTLGVLLKKMQVAIDTENYNDIKSMEFILIDEVHSSELDRDKALYYIKKLFEKMDKNEFPIVIFMSATLDIKLLSNYFNTKSIFEVSGNTYPITENYREPKVDIVSEIYDIVGEILTNNKFVKNESDIIIFCQSQTMIKKIKDSLTTNYSKKMDIIAFDSTKYNNVGEEYKKLFKNEDKMRIIITTNMAETGITLDSLKYCIDTGYQSSFLFDSENDMDYLISKNCISKASVKQRKGRVGRKRPGIFYGLYSEDSYNLLPEQPAPEIYTSKLDSFILNTIEKEDIYDIDLINKPAETSIRSSLNRLYILGFIDEMGNLTDIGKCSKTLFKLPFDHLKFLLSGFHYNVNIEDLALILVIINSRFKCTKFPDVYNCDFLQNFLIVKKLSTMNKSNFAKECIKYEVEQSAIKKLIYEKYNLLIEIVEEADIDVFYNNTNLYSLHPEDFKDYIYSLKKCIYEGFKLNLLTRGDDGLFYDVYDNKITIKSEKINDKKYVISNSILNNEVSSEMFYVSVLDDYVDIDHTFFIS